MQILPVIDLMNGQVVRGVAGRRKEYKPTVSRLTKSTDPIDVALAFREHFAFEEIYVADLDAIAGNSAALSVFADLMRRGFRLWIDAGLRGRGDASPLLDCGVATVIAGLETLNGPEALSELLALASPSRVVFSLDLKAGRPLTHSHEWLANNPFVIVEQAVKLGVKRVLVLDLAQVGAGAGIGTEALCRRLHDAFPTVELAAGGGVRDLHDVDTMRRAGLHWLLIASALHDGQLTPTHLSAALRPREK
jgi:phosphoribosylformimino-5-aminoimidazole carboxamide ribotide isomerase